MKGMKGIEVKGMAVALVTMLLVIILLYTWFFPTVNGTQGINNTSTLWFGGTNYSWFAPVLIVVLLFVVLMWFIGLI